MARTENMSELAYHIIALALACILLIKQQSFFSSLESHLYTMCLVLATQWQCHIINFNVRTEY